MKKPSMSPTSMRIAVCALVFAIGMATVMLRLWDEQIRRGERHRDRVARQSIRRIRQPAPRGKILTSDLRVVAEDEPSYDLVFHLAEMRQPGRRANTVNSVLAAARRTAAAIGRGQSPLDERSLVRHMNTRPGLPLGIFSGLSPREVAALAEMAPPIPGVELTVTPVRSYPEGDFCPHLIGYVGAADPATADDRGDFFYYVPDFVGRSGIERLYDVEVADGHVPLRGLRGEPGKSMVRVDHLGYVHETIGGAVPPISGNDVVMTIDYRAQQISQRLLAGHVGAIVLLDADDGSVLAMASSPAYDLSRMTPAIPRPVWDALNSDPERPLFNRALQAEYTPGSIFKPLIAMAILDFHPASERVFCGGGSAIGKSHIRCWSWRTGGHGALDMVGAIRTSCNTYFIDMALKIGLDEFVPYLESAGIGRRAGFPLAEGRGLMPSRAEKQRVFGQPWNAFDTGLISIGQGIVLVTPLQVAVFTAAIANGGIMLRPRIIKELRNPRGATLYRGGAEEVGQLKASQETLAYIREGMRQVVAAPDGTARQARCQVIDLYGKTGSAEVGREPNRYVNTWFTCFGEKDGRRYAMTVLVERAESGGRTAAPIAASFFQAWLGDQGR